MTANNLCGDDLQLPTDNVGPFGVYPCHEKTFPSQLFSLSLHNELRQEEHCAEVTGKQTVVLAECHGHKGSQEWLYEDGLMRNPDTGLCLSAEGVSSSAPMIVQHCDRKNKFQNWKFVRNFDL